LFGGGLAADESAEHPNHLQDFRDGPLVERDDRDAALDELRAKIGLQIGKREHEVRPQRFDLVELRADECRDLRLLPGLRRTNGIAGHPDDAILLSEKIQSLRGLLGQADDSIGIIGHLVILSGRSPFSHTMVGGHRHWPPHDLF